MPKLKFTQKKRKGKRKAGDDSAAPKKRAKLAPEPSDVFDEVLGNQELLERIMFFVPTNGELGRIASVNKLFNTSSTSKTLWDARAKHYPTLTLDNTKLDKVKLYHRTGKFMKALLLLDDDADEDEDRETPWGVDDFNWYSPNDLEELTKEYLKFMTIRRDRVWHAHILNTHDYKAFCKQVFGHFMHHIPGEAHEPNGGFDVYDYELTIDAYEKRFGKPGEGLTNPMIWPSLNVMEEFCYVDEGCGCG